MTDSQLFETHKREYEELEYKLLSYCGLSVPDQIRSFNIPIFKESWIHEVTCGNSEEHILLLHGYGGTSLTFIRTFKDLSQRYTVHALDLLGMGLSHREQFNPEWTKEQVINYYIDSIEEWRKVRNIQNFVVLGHSYGGYIASCYSFKYTPRVMRLYLISPAGTKHGNAQTNNEDYERLYSQSSCFRKILLSVARRVVKSEPTPSCAMTSCCFGPIFMDQALGNRLHLKDKQKQQWKNYMLTLSKLKPNSELSFWKLFHFPSISTSQSTYTMFAQKQVPFKILFFYGDSDWMEKQTALSMSKAVKINQISYTIIPDSGHQIFFDNPKEMMRYLL